MSKQAVRELLQKAEQNADLNAALDAALCDQKTAVQSFLAVAREHGCEFTADEFLDVMDGPDASGSAELSDSELQSVTGGLTPSYSWSRLATKTFQTYRSSPSIRQIGLGGVAQSMEEEEELIQP